MKLWIQGIRSQTRARRTVIGNTTMMTAALACVPAMTYGVGKSVPGPGPIVVAYCYDAGDCCEGGAPLVSPPCCPVTPDESTTSTASTSTSLACTAQGTNTRCLGDQACCMPDGSCVDSDARCCDDLGGVAAGGGTTCATSQSGMCMIPLEACCSSTGSCTDVQPWACGGTPGGPGSACGGDLDGDGFDDGACDNCPGCANSPQTDTDGDGVGDDCDNCVLVANPRNAGDFDCDGDGFIDPAHGEQAGGQCNSDTDNRGDACDNCPTVDNTVQTDSDARCSVTGDSCGPIGGEYQLCAYPHLGNVCQTDTTYANGYAGFGDACDNCDFLLSAVQVDCDADGDGDPCDADLVDCDGDEVDDACDDDIDDDGVPNDLDVCDYTPSVPTSLGGDIVRDPTHPLYGTLLGDLDGDCDVDADDQAILDANFTDVGCNSGSASGEGCAASPATP